jgi:hypothetical protein
MHPQMKGNAMSAPSLVKSKWISVIYLTHLIFLISGCTPKINAGDSNLVSSIYFPGISSIDQVSGNGVRINWNTVSGASAYYVYNTTSGSLAYLGFVASPTASYIVTGLNPSTTYRFLVRMVDNYGQRDTNTNYVSATTQSTTVSHQGWTQAKALGGRTPVSQAVGFATTSPSVTLAWNQMTSTNATVTSYNIYRGTSSGGETYSSPRATGITTTALTYTDSTVSNSTNYYYIVKPVVGTTELATTSTDTEIKIMVPPQNMSFVHRWIANWEMCSNLMGRTYDRNNNYRCAYVGPASNGGYYDIGQNQMWDTVELGCNYTATAGACSPLTHGCIGSTGSPNTAVNGTVGQVYYDQSAQNCYISTGGTAWTAVSNALTNSQLALVASNQPGLPPLVNITQTLSQTVCQQFTVPGLGTKRLPKHSEQIVAGAWPPSFTDAQISTIENGTGNLATGYCNSNSPGGYTFSATLPGALPSPWDTLPATTSEAFVTGSNATQNCVSLHGIQDLVGNVWEWSSDQITSCGAPSNAANICTTTAVGTADATNTDWYNSSALAINYNGNVGPGGAAVAAASWAFSAGATYSATDFLAPLGLPLLASVASNYDATVIGTGTGQINPAKFHGNFFYLQTSNSPSSARGAFFGGAWASGSQSGRFSLGLINTPADSNNGFGLRCSVPAGN